MGPKFVVSNAFDCIKHCITDSSCQAYQIGYTSSHELNCHLFSEAIGESPSIPTNLGFKRTIGIKPQRLSSQFHQIHQKIYNQRGEINVANLWRHIQYASRGRFELIPPRGLRVKLKILTSI